ncbi:MAG: class I SAM-dependent methyltransferase [Luteolibacter sp.]
MFAGEVGTPAAFLGVMPTQSLRRTTPDPVWFDCEFPRLPDDCEFDQILPRRLREYSAFHWTTVEVCRHAATWLVSGPETRVLDVGCGPGKFCAIGAFATAGHFTGVEQRKRLCRTAWDMLEHYCIPRVRILHANVMEMSFGGFDAFYLFNPFEENLAPEFKIDDEVPVEIQYYGLYIDYVRRQLSQLRLGTRVVTFWGSCHEIPPCYDCEETAFDGKLRLWMKRRDLPVEQSSFAEALKGDAAIFSII